jgi:hypothetical protein
VNFLTDKNDEDFWIGANDIDIEDDWVLESTFYSIKFMICFDGKLVL